jgi:predicted Rossmann fold nucleotide-binding protein DprA/Smf involved in DNA uptake
MKFGVIGSRSFEDYDLLKNELTKHDITCIISGGAKGADSLAEQYAFEHNIPTTIHKPDWSIGRHAGFLRNKTIVEESDRIIAFWDGTSKGTLSSINYAKKYGKPTIIIQYNKI